MVRVCWGEEGPQWLEWWRIRRGSGVACSAAGRLRGVAVVAGRTPNTQLDIMCIIGDSGRPVGKGFSRSGWSAGVATALRRPTGGCWWPPSRMAGGASMVLGCWLGGVGGLPTGCVVGAGGFGLASVQGRCGRLWAKFGALDPSLFRPGPLWQAAGQEPVDKARSRAGAVRWALRMCGGPILGLLSAWAESPGLTGPTACRLWGRWSAHLLSGARGPWAGVRAGRRFDLGCSRVQGSPADGCPCGPQGRALRCACAEGCVCAGQRAPCGSVNPFRMVIPPCFMHKRCYASFCRFLWTHDRFSVRASPEAPPGTRVLPGGTPVLRTTP